MEMSPTQFEQAVAAALDRLPMRFAELLSNVAVQTADHPPPELLAQLGLDPSRQTLFGCYRGVPLEARGGFYGNALPDVILLFRGPLVAACADHDTLRRRIQLTLLHEIGHHFGLSDSEMAAWEVELDDEES